MKIIIFGIAVLTTSFTSVAAEAIPLDPVSYRTAKFCKQQVACIKKQRRGIQMFLKEITTHPRPSSDRVRWCLKRSTNKQGIEDWAKAARCIR